MAADRGLGEPGERLDLLLALHRARSRGAAELGDWPEVVAQLEVVRERSELDSDELLLLARARYATGGAADGKRMLDELLASPEWPPASALLFAEQHGTAELKRARRLLDEALERSPADPQLIASAVRLDLADGERARAKARLGGAIDHRKGGAEVLLLLRAKLGVEDGDVAAAANDARKAFNADPRLPDAVVALVATHRAVDDEQVAFQLLDQAERAQRLDAAGLADACRAWIQRGVFDRALALCTGALKLKNDLPRAQGDLAYLLARRGGRHLEEALGLAQDAIDALGADPDSSATLGFLYWRKRLYSPSVTYLERALELSADAKPPAGFDLGPTHSEASIHFFLGRALEGAGRDSLASQALERALTLDPAVEERVGLPGLHSQAN